MRFEPAAFRLTADISYRLRNRAFASWLRVLFRHDWVVYAKRPFGGPEHALRYLGAYTHRVAISNSRRTPTERSLKCPPRQEHGGGPKAVPERVARFLELEPEPFECDLPCQAGTEQVFVEPSIAPGGRKPPLMAEVGQSILREHNIGIVRFMQAKELRGLRGCKSGR